MRALPPGLKSVPYHYRCSCSYLQLYNNEITDLLAAPRKTASPHHASLKIRQSADRGMYVEGLQEVPLGTPEEALRILARGSANRKVACTLMNETSSRSHAVFLVFIEQVTPTKGGANRVVRTQLSLIDLAGSERQQKSASIT